jgi:hypothetical protein
MQRSTVEIEEIIRSFVEQVVALVHRQTVERIQNAVSSAFAGATVSPKTRASVQPAPATAQATPKGRKLNLSPQALAVRKLQGKYMSIIKRLPAATHERVRKVAHEQGVAAAIRFVSTLQ